MPEHAVEVRQRMRVAFVFHDGIAAHAPDCPCTVGLDKVPVSVSEWLFGSFVVIPLVIMCISPVSTVIFPKNETVMLSTPPSSFSTLPVQ